MNDKQNNRFSPSRRIQNQYIIPDDYDKTPEDLLPLDNY